MGKSCVKVRGFTLNTPQSLELINFETMRKMLEDSVLKGKHTPIRTIEEGKIKRKLPERKLLTVNQPKVYSFKYFKNTIGQDFYSYPWGYKE